MGDRGGVQKPVGRILSGLNMADQAHDDDALAARLGQIADQYTESLRRGEKPDIERYAREHPELAADGGRRIYLTYIEFEEYFPHLVEVTFA